MTFRRSDGAIETAQRYAASGSSVLRFRSDMRLQTRHRFHDPTTHPEAVRAVWAEWQDAQVAVACRAVRTSLVDLGLGDGKDSITPATPLRVSAPTGDVR